MSTSIIILFILFFGLRLSTLVISIKNEKRLKQAGAREYGAVNSHVLALLHVVFYFSSLAEGYLDQVQFDRITIIGILLYVLSMVALFYVIQQLSPIWTVKLIIAKDHTLNQGALFRYIRHPNYFLNVIPELLGLVLMMKSYFVLATLFPVYLISLAVRIVQEEKLMKSKFADY